MGGSDWGFAGVGAAIVAVIGAIGLLIERVYKARSRARRQTKTDDQRQESAAVRKLEEVIEALVDERQQDRDQMHELRNQMVRLSNEVAICRIGRARADERILALEEALTQAGHPPQRKWNPEITDTGSGVHPAFPENNQHPPQPKSGRNKRPKVPPTSEGEDK